MICLCWPSSNSASFEKGHAVHFRCKQSGVEGLRADVMAVLGGVVDGEEVDLLSLQDLVIGRGQSGHFLDARIEDARFAMHGCG